MNSRILKIIKRSLIFAVLLTLGVQVNYQLFYYLLFKLNVEELSQSMCEQKVTDCNACCYLNKQFDSAEEDHKSSETGRNRNLKADNEQVQKFIVLYSSEKEFSENRKDYYISKIFLPSLLLSQKIFHPPEVTI